MPDASTSQVAAVTPSSRSSRLSTRPTGQRGQLGAELDVAGQREVRQLVDAPAEQRRLGELGAVA